MKMLSLNIGDLWVATAINADNEEVFENDDADLEEPFKTMFGIDGDKLNDDNIPPAGGKDALVERGLHFAGRVVPSVMSTRHSSFTLPFRHPSTSYQQMSQSPQWHRPSLQYGASSGQPTEIVSPPCRFSNTVPMIFVHLGVRTLPAVAEVQRMLNAPEPVQQQESGIDVMLTIEEKEPSLMSQLPFAIITQSEQAEGKARSKIACLAKAKQEVLNIQVCYI